MLYTCDLICYGVATPMIFQSFLAMLEKYGRKPLREYVHRGSGLQAHDAERAVYWDGTSISETAETRVWRHIWYHRLCRESCYRCGYHSTKRPGDLTIGDWWGLERFASGVVDSWGVSCAISSTPRGLSLLRDASDALELMVTPVADVANPAQPMLIHPPERKGRDAFWPELYAHGFEVACRSVGALGVERAVKDLVKKALSIFKGSSAGDVDVAAVDHAWSEVPVVDFNELKARGEYPVAFAARNRADSVRKASSSGGVYHALASHVVNNLGGVVYGCAFDDELRAVHVRCETMHEVERCMGSKYSQSDMGNSVRRVREDLEAGRTVLFTGTPCQVAAVRAVCADVAG